MRFLKQEINLWYFKMKKQLEILLRLVLIVRKMQMLQRERLLL